MTSDSYNAFIEKTGPDLPSNAGGPLSGYTLAIKDIFDVAGYVTGCGNPQREAEGEPAKQTATAVQCLLDAGARFIGKTQTDELAFSLTGDNAHFPRPVNPAAPDRFTGGSSSGSAAAVAAGLADIATGSDTGGSIRGPASWCGLAGLRTTHGAIPLDGAMKLAESFDTFGWFARDMALYMKVAAQLLPEAGNRFGRIMRLPEIEALMFGGNELTAYGSALSVVESVAGPAKPVAITGVSVDERYWSFRRIQAYEAWREHGTWISAADRELGPGVKERFAFGATVDPATYEADSATRKRLTDEVIDLLGGDGLIVLPTMPGAAPFANASFDDVQDYRERALRMLCLSGLSGTPQLTLPLARIDGAPFGISILGPHGSDRALLELGRDILEAGTGEGARKWTL